jgi:addiction module HigA family antidote
VTAKTQNCSPPAPHLLIRERLLQEGRSQAMIARALGVSDARLSMLLNGRFRITPETALRLAQVTNTAAHYWLELQMDYDLFHARKRFAPELERLQPLAA